MSVKMHGMNPPSQKRSADGTWFIAVNHPSDRGRFAIYREYADGRSVELDETRLRYIGGQGKLESQDDGTLWASFGVNAGTSMTDRFQIKQYVPFAPRVVAPSGFAGLDLTGMWNSVLTAAHENDGLMHLRWNNLREMLNRNAKK